MATTWLDEPDGDGLWWFTAQGDGGWTSPTLVAVGGTQGVVVFSSKMSEIGGLIGPIKRGFFKWTRQSLPDAPEAAHER